VFVTLENGAVTGGFGTGVEELLAGNGYHGRVLRYGWPDEFVPHGSTSYLMERFGLLPEPIAQAALAAL
jgi:1-deoxy-D-xylulose-5-phosphate synthase